MIERSDALVGIWTDVGFVPATGDGSGSRSYTYLDAEAGLESRALRYRLRMIDFDGSYEHSPIVEVAAARTPVAVEFARVYPSPARDWMTVRFALPETMPGTLAIHDVSGRERARPHDGEILAAGEYTLSLPVSAWRSGLYVLSLVAGGTRRVGTVLVLL